MSLEEISIILLHLSKNAASQNNEWIPLYAALGGSIAAALAGCFTSIFIEYRKNRAGSVNLTKALIIEILALVRLIEKRGYVKSLSDVAFALRNEPAGNVYNYSVNIPEHYSKIYQTQCHNIGLIESKIAIKIITFHQLIDAVVQDIKEGGTFSDGIDFDGANEDLAFLNEALKLANELERYL